MHSSSPEFVLHSLHISSSTLQHINFKGEDGGNFKSYRCFYTGIVLITKNPSDLPSGPSWQLTIINPKPFYQSNPSSPRWSPKGRQCSASHRIWQTDKIIKKQVLIEFVADEDRFEIIFLISPQLINSASLGSAFARAYGITIAFVTKCFYYEKEGSSGGHSFDQSSGSLDARSNEQELKEDPSHSCWRITYDFPSPFRQISGLYLKIRPRPLRSISFPIHYSCRVVAKVVSSRLPTVGAQISIPGQVMWDLWWLKWHLGLHFPSSIFVLWTAPHLLITLSSKLRTSAFATGSIGIKQVKK
jgi:hypothetical protein